MKTGNPHRFQYIYIFSIAKVILQSSGHPLLPSVADFQKEWKLSRWYLDSAATDLFQILFVEEQFLYIIRTFLNYFKYSILKWNWYNSIYYTLTILWYFLFIFFHSLHFHKTNKKFSSKIWFTQPRSSTRWAGHRNICFHYIAFFFSCCNISFWVYTLHHWIRTVTDCLFSHHFSEYYYQLMSSYRVQQHQQFLLEVYYKSSNFLIF